MAIGLGFQVAKPMIIGLGACADALIGRIKNDGSGPPIAWRAPPAQSQSSHTPDPGAAGLAGAEVSAAAPAGVAEPLKSVAYQPEPFN